MKDHKGYEQRPMDEQDSIILWACVAAAVALLLINWWPT